MDLWPDGLKSAVLNAQKASVFGLKPHDWDCREQVDGNPVKTPHLQSIVQKPLRGCNIRAIPLLFDSNLLKGGSYPGPDRGAPPNRSEGPRAKERFNGL